MTMTNLTRMVGLSGIAAATVLISVAAIAGPRGNVPFPANYRHWTHTKSVVAFNKDDPFFGFRNVYANDPALEAMKTGVAYPDGSVLIMSFHQPIKGDGTYAMGKAIKYVVMAKDRKKFAATDGWGYEAYKAKGLTPIVGNAMMAKCHGCHVGGAKKSDFVFSKYAR